MQNDTPHLNSERMVIVAGLARRILGVMLFLLAVEGVLHAKARVMQKPHMDRDWGVMEDFFQYSDTLGYKPRANSRCRSNAKYGNETVYDVVYTIDTHSRRETPLLNSRPPDKFALLFGGSFSFGEGLSDNETMAAQLTRFAPGYRAYNFGFFGYGPQQMLENLKNSAISEEIQEKTGLAVYTFIDHHISVAIGSLYVSLNEGQNVPYYALSGNGDLVKKGHFFADRPFLTTLYLILSKSRIVSCLGTDLPWIRERHIRVTAKIIEESREVFRQRFGSDDFYYIVYPGSKFGGRLIPYLEKAGITCLDYTELFNPSDPDYYIKHDLHHHPNAYAFHLVMKKFAKDIGIYGGEEKTADLN